MMEENAQTLIASVIFIWLYIIFQTSPVEDVLDTLFRYQLCRAFPQTLNTLYHHNETRVSPCAVSLSCSSIQTILVYAFTQPCATRMSYHAHPQSEARSSELQS
jgi:hypothetical protein